MILERPIVDQLLSLRIPLACVDARQDWIVLEGAARALARHLGLAVDVDPSDIHVTDEYKYPERDVRWWRWLPAVKDAELRGGHQDGAPVTVPSVFGPYRVPLPYIPTLKPLEDPTKSGLRVAEYRMAGWNTGTRRWVFGLTGEGPA